LFGSSQGGNFFTRFTTVLAVLFMCTSLGLTVLKSRTERRSIFDQSSNIPASSGAPSATAPAPTNASDAAAPSAAPAAAPTATPAAAETDKAK
jgi:preprotein translocase subunit SecG